MEQPLFNTLIGYVFSILLSYPTIKKYSKLHEDQLAPYNPVFFAKFVSIIPGLNLYTAYICWYEMWRNRRSLKKIAKRLKDKFKDHEDPEVREQISNLADEMDKLGDSL